MTISEIEYLAYRTFLRENMLRLVEIERQYMAFLVETVLLAAPDIYSDFSRSQDLVPFWIAYPPKQRGRAPIGDAFPWSEVGEKTIAFNLVRAIVARRRDVTFPGLPFGADIRFATNDALIHVDVKLTGPRDNVHELVVPPQQISGDGIGWNKGMVNSPFYIQGLRSSFQFQPKLPPFYVLDGHMLPCLTFFLKVVYSVRSVGEQPLESLEMACLPNSLLLFDGPLYAQTPGLLIPGKDDRGVDDSDKRIRIRLYPLATLEDGWRCRQIVPVDVARREWETQPRTP